MVFLSCTGMAATRSICPKAQSTELCNHQAFSVGRHALAFQFHPEAQQKGFERWLIGDAGEIAATIGVSVPALRSATATHAPRTAAAGQECLTGWLSKLA